MLAQRIRDPLNIHTIFESELSRLWPSVDKEREKRKERIRDFAKHTAGPLQFRPE
jgi:hypothetical protein